MVGARREQRWGAEMSGGNILALSGGLAEGGEIRRGEKAGVHAERGRAAADGGAAS